MSDYTVKSIEELESIHHGAVKLAGAELGIRSFGMQVLDFPAGFSEYPAHDHADDGQEEVYVLLRGSAEFQIDDERLTVGPGELVRIAPPATRKLVAGPDGARILAVGCAGDRPYERPEHFRLEVRA
ncbi:MAG TPA: cupin domain-containing protein [Solirubrobacteraceae bacterium]|nr:cupin domain-containing protein [Solirubrobacteraceae bacterium]